MKLGLQLGYWGATPPANALEKVLEAEKLGFDIVFTAEAYGSDALTPLAWWGSATSTIRLGTSIVQMSARTPTATAMAAMTLDHLSGGRFALGLGLSGPQVVEGWYGRPFAQPLARTREYVDIVRRVLAREQPVTSEGPHYPIPYQGPGATGYGKPLRSIVHPLRADIPVYLGAEGPKNVALSAEIADGWLPMYFSPRVGAMYRSWLAEGFARPGARRNSGDFEIMASVSVVVTDDRDRVLQSMKPTVALYAGGMGAKEVNFHKEVFARMGYASQVETIQDLYLAGKKDEAIAAVPDEMVGDVCLVGTAGRIRDEVSMWEEAGVTAIVVGARDVTEMRRVAEAILG
ncbi:MAG: LLM class F420-dependent oxidoreductase [Acidimicrobiales bacterium]